MIKDGWMERQHGVWPLTYLVRSKSRKCFLENSLFSSIIQYLCNNNQQSTYILFDIAKNWYKSCRPVPTEIYMSLNFYSAAIQIFLHMSVNLYWAASQDKGGGGGGSVRT